MTLFAIIFLLLPPGIIAYAHARAGWKLVIALLPVFVVIGVVLMIANLVLADAMLKRAIDSNPNPPQELVERYFSDGGRNLFVATFGWIVSGIYYLLWMTILGIGFAIARIGKKCKSPVSNE